MIPRIIIAGGSGFIGRHLCRHLAASGYDITVLTRQSPPPANSLSTLNPQPSTLKISTDESKITFVQWDGVHPGPWFEILDGAYAVINLAGENIAAGRWTQEKKRRIRDSRLAAGEILTQAVQQARVKPGIFIQASAIGYYGDHDDTFLDETAPPGNSFLAQVAQKWEAASEPLDEIGVRRPVIRLGVVLGRDGGVLDALTPLFKMFFGGYPAHGRQWFSWVHIDDAVRAFRFILENDNLTGTFNLAAPNPVTARQFCESLGAALHRPAFLSIPRLTLKLAMGELADELLLSSQRVLPKRLLDAAFTFHYPVIDQAIKQIFP